MAAKKILVVLTSHAIIDSIGKPTGWFLSEFVHVSDEFSEFDAIYWPGGHGPMFDLAVDRQPQELNNEFWAQGKIISAVCHGSAALINVKLPNREHLIKDKTVTGFSNEEEIAIAQLAKFMSFMLESKLHKASGVKFVKANETWAEKVVVEGKLVAGENLGSSKAISQDVIRAVRA
ncbi:hypothetical protein ACHAQJ_002993 [Trichoderma viride]